MYSINYTTEMNHANASYLNSKLSAEKLPIVSNQRGKVLNMANLHMELK